MIIESEHFHTIDIFTGSARQLVELFMFVCRRVAREEGCSSPNFYFPKRFQDWVAYCPRLGNESVPYLTAEHTFEIAWGLIEAIDLERPDGEIEYPHLRYIPESYGVRNTNRIETLTYFAMHECAHMVLYHRFGEVAIGEEHSQAFASVLLELMDKYWERF